MSDPLTTPDTFWRAAGALLDAVGDIVVGLDRSGRVVWVNEAAICAAAARGIDARSTVGRLFMDGVPFAIDPQFAALFRNLADLQEPREIDLLVPGTDREVSARLVPLPFGVALVVHERSENRIAKRAQRAYEERYRTLFDAVPLPLVVYHRETALVLAVNSIVNDQLAAVPELVGAPVSTLLDTSELPRYEQERQTSQGGPQTRGLWKLRSLRGGLIEAEVTSFDLEFDGQPARMALIRDVTDARLAEAERSLLRAAIGHINDLLVITRAQPDENGTRPIVFVNEAFERHTGWHRDEVIGLPGTILEGPATDAAVSARIADQMQRGHDVRAELVHYTKDGREYWVELVIVPVTNDKGEHTHWVSVHRNVSERKTLEEQLFQAQKMEAVGRLAGGVAHDFNNVLTAISGFSELLLEELPVDGEAHEEVMQIRAAAARATALTRQLLAFSRKQIMRPRPVDVGALVRNMERLIARVTTEEITIRLTIDDTVPPVVADPVQLEQVLLNLAVNGSEAMPDGGTLSIEVSDVALGESYAHRHHGVQPGHYVCLVVTDSGVGMDKATRERIFEPFFTTKTGGTGLGLSTVYGIVRQSGGDAWVYSELGLGSTFKIYLPVATAPESAPETPVAVTSVLGGTETVLVVEDEALVRDVTRAMLERRGYHVLLANDGEHAMRVAESYFGTIDLLLTDVVMPRANGRRVAERLRMLRPDIRVLYMSGYTEDAIVHHGVLDAGITLLEKPFTELDLARSVRELLDAPAPDQ